MQFASECSPLAPHHRLWWLGLVIGAAAWTSIATSVAQPSTGNHPVLRGFPSGPVVDGHHVQPRAGQFAPPYGRPDVSDEDAREIQDLYNSLTRHTRAMCPSADASSVEREC